jgi:hypothetical protein
VVGAAGWKPLDVELSLEQAAMMGTRAMAAGRAVTRESATAGLSFSPWLIHRILAMRR